MKSGEIRIIGGKWRGRKLRFPAVSDIRPSPDRIRETLFNWLAPVIIDARCLDLFAGSGALGLEALSRGATHTTFVDASNTVITYLEKQLQILGIENASIHRLQIPSDFFPETEAYNIIFLDPPFHQNLIEPVSRWLEEKKLLANDALIYIETESTLNTLPIPTNWEILKSKKAGQVNYYLARRTT